jgi:hypothetical protein
MSRNEKKPSSRAVWEDQDLETLVARVIEGDQGAWHALWLVLDWSQTITAFVH